MKKLLFLVIVAVAAAVSAEAYVPLANTVRKLKQGSLRVAVIGDSIGYGQYAGGVTLQGVSYSSRSTANVKGMPKGNPMSYARIFTDYVKHIAAEKYSVADGKVETFYSTWGGATSMTAFGYLSTDVLARRPDLVLFQVWNDCPEALRYAEATLRAIWSVSPETDVILLSVGGCFANPSVHKPLMQKYGVPFVESFGPVHKYYGQFGVLHSNDYGFLADGRVQGSRGYLFGNSWPHVNEEGYIWFGDRLLADFDALLAKAEQASGKCEPVVTAEALGSAPIEAKGDFCGSSSVVSPASLTAEGAVDTAAWTISVSEKPDMPRDTMDRAVSDRLTAKNVGATIETSVTGRFLFFRGVSGMELSLDGGATFVKPGQHKSFALTDGAEDVTKKIVLKASAKNSWFNEFYVYGAAARPVPAVPAKHRWTVRYFARIADINCHNWELNGQPVVPHPLSWLQVFRDETFESPLKVAEEKVISGDCATNGVFLGWVEPDAVVWKGSERLMTVKSFDGKRIYKPGEELDMVKLGHDLDLVAAYSGGPFPAECARTYKATFMMGPAFGDRRVALLDAPAAKPVIRLPELPTRPYFAAKGWKVINTDEVLAAGSEFTLKTDTEFVAVWAFDENDRKGVTVDGGAVTVDFATRVGSLRACFDAEVNGARCGVYGQGSEESGWPFSCNGMAYSVSRAEDGYIRAKVTNQPSYWKYPTFYGYATVPVKLSSVRNVSVAYRYEPAGEAKIAGQHMNLVLRAKTPDGLKTVGLAAKSVEPIEPGSGKVANFVFTPPADNDSYIEGIEFKYYDVGSNNRATNLSAGNFGKNDAFCLGPITFK